MAINLEQLNLNRFESIINFSSKNVVFCSENDTIEEVIDKIVTTDHRRIPIVSKRGIVVGIITKSDLLDAFLRREDFDEKISNIMNRDLILCEAHDSLEHVLQKFKISRRGGFPVVEKEKIVGMISERDFVNLLPNENIGIKVKNAMTKKPFVTQPNISIYDCLKMLVNTHYRRLPIVESVEGKGKLIGIVTATDLLKYIHEHDYDFETLDEELDKIMIKNVCTAGPEDDLASAAKTMVSKKMGGLPVVNSIGDLEGIITERDILEQID